MSSFKLTGEMLLSAIKKSDEIRHESEQAMIDDEFGLQNILIDGRIDLDEIAILLSEEIAKQRTRSLSGRRKSIEIQGATYESKEAAAKAFGVSVHTVKSAKSNGKLDTLGSGKSSNVAYLHLEDIIEKRRKKIEFQGSVFSGWKQAVHITGMSRQTLLKRGAIVR